MQRRRFPSDGGKKDRSNGVSLPPVQKGLTVSMVFAPRVCGASVQPCEVLIEARLMPSKGASSASTRAENRLRAVQRAGQYLFATFWTTACRSRLEACSRLRRCLSRGCASSMRHRRVTKVAETSGQNARLIEQIDQESRRHKERQVNAPKKNLPA